ncbi:MAG TPA: N-6 DNA methylase [Methylophilaceae bacterium]|jgi:hypothetical protein
MNKIKTELEKLVNRFKADEFKYTSSSSSYQETEVRVEFIDPLFSLLGWQMDNSVGLPSAQRDVLREESHQTESTTKKPDYTFRIATVRKFFVEAKRPSVDICINKDSAFQVRSYGYTAGHRIAVLTNFRTLSIYDAQLEPKANDKADVGLLMTINYDSFISRFDDIIEVLGRDEVAAGAIEAKFKSTATGSIPANASFLNRINNWRVRIAQDLFSRYPNLTIEELTDFTQKIINRIIFIRMCEDRGIEGEYVLRNVANTKNIVELRTLFKRLDDRYNTGLFDVTKDRLQDTYEIDADIFIGIVDEVYTPNSPYSFGVLDADFLGQVYELFLGQQLAFRANGTVALEAKPAYVHREIVTTPQPLVDEVVRRVFHSKFTEIKLQGPLTMDSIKSLHVFDVAVGSSRFLLQAFDEMIEAVIRVLQAQGNNSLIYRVTDNNYKLAFTVKRDILSNCLFGCDIDYNAVEIARFSLMVRLLEDETKDTLPSAAQTKILPDLDNNIIHGNTVVNALNFQHTSGGVFDKTQPLNWTLTTLPIDFDIVVGNPPYVKTEEMLSENADEVAYYKKNYASARRQFDKYFVFIELAISKMKTEAWLGMVVPNKWITIESGEKLRGILSKHDLVSQIVDFGNEKLFEGKSAYVCLLILSKNGATDLHYRHVNDYQDFLTNPQDIGFNLSATFLKNSGSASWVFPTDKNEALVLNKLMLKSVPLSKLINVKNGIQTSANDVYLIDQYTVNGNYINFTKNGVNWSIESSITRPYINDSTRVVSYQSINADALMIFPYELSTSTGKPVAIEPKDMMLRFPNAMAYLNSNKARLLKRSVSPSPKAGVFYAYGRHQALEAVFLSPKIIYSVNQKGDKYGLDTFGVAYASGGTAGEVALTSPKNGYALEFFLGLLNQRAIEFFARKRGSPFGGGWYARGSAVVNDIPVPFLDIRGNVKDKAIHDAIVNDVKALLAVNQQIKTASGRSLQPLANSQKALLNSIESKFNVIWGFNNQVKNLVLPGE